MKALSHPFQLTFAQKWHNAWYGAAAADCTPTAIPAGQI